MKKYLAIFIAVVFLFGSTTTSLFAIEDTNGVKQSDEANVLEGNTEQSNETTSSVREDPIQNEEDQSIPAEDEENVPSSQEGKQPMQETPSSPTEAVGAKEPTISYRSHIQDYGWQNYVASNEISGTTGQGKRMESIQLKLDSGDYEGSITYQAHVQDYGWMNTVNNDEISGTVGQSKRLEAMRIGLTGELANSYDIYYRVHAQNFGWLGWAKNNESAGTQGCSYRLEAIQIILVKKGESAPGDTNNTFYSLGSVNYSTHIQDYGWQGAVNSGATSGTVGQSRRLEAINITVFDNTFGGGIEYSTHIQDYGWQGYVGNGTLSGTTGRSKRLEAIKIRLTGELANHFDVYYRVHAQNIGWMGWTYNDNIAGTTGGSYRLEAIQIKICPKNAGMPGRTVNSSIGFNARNGYLVCYDANGSLHEDAQGMIGAQGPYQLRVNKATNVVTVIARDGNGTYNIAYKRFVCSTGSATPLGSFRTPAKYRWKELMGPSYGQFSTRIVGGVLFHSVPYNRPNNRTLSARMYNQLGTTCSHGCVRLTTGDAKWIYDNCALGTIVHVVAGGGDPLSKPSASKLPLNQTWDPTDPTL